nr:hypothetical protein [Sphingomonas sp. Y57]
MSATLQPILLFISFLALQISSLFLLPMSQGFTRLWPTIFCMAVLVASMWCLSRLLQSGVALGILMPMTAAALPLVAMVIGIFVWGESFSITKTCLLITGCVLVGFASRI